MYEAQPHHNGCPTFEVPSHRERMTMSSFSESAKVPVTRIELLDSVGEIFGDSPVDRAALVRAAAQAGARDALLARLSELPEGPFTEPSELWLHLPDVPVDLQQP